MPTASGNVARLGLALQSGFGVPCTTPQWWLNMTGGGITPTPEIEQRSETGLGRDVGASFIRVLSASGDPAILLRPESAGLILYAVLGTKAASAGPSVYTHTITPANDQPYLTVWKEQGDQLYERFTDCKITTCNIEWTAGGDLAASLNIFGLGFTKLSPAAGATAGGLGIHDQAVPFRVPGAIYTLNNVVDNTLASGNFNIDAAQTPIQTVTSTYSYLIPGQRVITFGYEGVWVDINRYSEVYYGSAGGTSPTTTIFAAPLRFQWGVSAGAGTLAVPVAGDKFLELSITQALWTEAAPSMDPGGAPMMLSVAGGADRATPIMQVKVVNATATYPTGT